MLINVTVTGIFLRNQVWRVPSKKFKRHGLPLFITLSDEYAVSEVHIGPTQHLRWSSL